MLRIAYLFDIENPSTFAGRTVADGFRNAWQNRGDDCRFFDLGKISQGRRIQEQSRFNRFDPHLVFTSVENIPFLPKQLNKDTKLVLWGQFYKPCDYEPQIHHILPPTKDLLRKLARAHDILIWSQHDESINDRFFSGYERELGLKFIQLLHAADHTKYVAASDSETKFDFMWIGNIGHRKASYDAFVNPLKKLSNSYLSFHEYNRVDPHIIDFNQLFRKSLIIPNVHTPAQIRYQILLNERVFTAAMQGGFQLCDNPLARKYFSPEELVIAETPEEFSEKFLFFKQNPDKRLPYLKKIQTSILTRHTYRNRINEILCALIMQ